MLSQTDKELRSAIRNQLRSERRALNETQRHQLAELCRQRLAEYDLLSSTHNIALYCDSDGEVPTQSIMEFLWASGKSVFVPVINNGGQMDFVALNQNEDLVSDRFEISIPAEKKVPVNPEILDLVIAPLVAFDKQGNRLGRGGGYYDRFMQRCDLSTDKRRNLSANKRCNLSSNKRCNQSTNTSGGHKPVFLGLAYSFQQTKNIPHAKWDKRLDAVITDKELISF